MSKWSEQVNVLQQSGQAAILVSVDSIVGSTPREPGARMIVTEQTQIGTIGGGNLEFQAAQIARDQLQTGAAAEVRRFPLGAGLGQCCGGLVNLMFERLDEYSDWMSLARETPQLVLYLFGAGHVGQAIVHVLHPLPIQIKWIDTRDDVLSMPPPTGVEFICTDTPESEVDAATASAWFLVMTHDHALDQRLAEQILKRDDFDYFGLIGSRAKRRNFETRMARRGINPETFHRMTCPIGIEDIGSKQPAQIAISVAAEILQVYDQLQKTDNNNPPIYGLEVNP
ncbi:MAG: xanthine dehydrogenase accessory protein XdhC [Pseudomonadota bacterium]